MAREEAGSAELPDPGFVYLLTNAAMPNFVKIGLTRKDDVTGRVRDLDTTSMPLPFEIAYHARVPHCAKLERVLHKVFADKRVRHNREFFTANPDLARLIIDLVKIDDLAVSDADQGITPEQRTNIEEAKVRQAPRLTFERLGLVAGTILTASKSAALTCQVASATKVMFEGELMSPSGAALKALHQLGYTWPAVSGYDFWTYDGVKLTTLATTAESDPDS